MMCGYQCTKGRTFLHLAVKLGRRSSLGGLVNTDYQRLQRTGSGNNAAGGGNTLVATWEISQPISSQPVKRCAAGYNKTCGVTVWAN